MKNVTILIIDDKPANIFTLEKLLEKSNHSFLTATSGKAGLALALNNEIDLVILDVQMPDMDGFEVAQILKSGKNTKDIPIIFASAEKTERSSMMKGFDEGAVDYLSKPLDPEITRAKVRVLLQIQQQKKELIEKNGTLEKSALLINNSADIIGILNPVTLMFEQVNEAFHSILGYSAEESTQTAVTHFLHDHDIKLVEKLTKSDKARLSFETRIHTKSKSVKWLHWHVIVKSGKWFVNARDVTDLKEAERIRNYLATTVKESKDAIYIHDPEGRIISWNEGAEQIYGYNEQEALNMKIWSIIPEYALPQAQQALQEVLNEHNVHFQEAKRISKDGHLLDVLFSASAIIDVNDQQKSIAVTERDITQQKLADEKILQLNTDLLKNLQQLESANKELESFSYSVSHDLRAPLRILDGFSNMLQEDFEGQLGDEGSKLLEGIRHNAQRMNNLIEDLLKFSKLGRKELEKSSIDNTMLVARVIKEVSQSSPHNAELIVHPVMNVQADYALLAQVWTNLISNAIKYSSKKQKPVVEISSIKTAEGSTFCVKDNGAGFNMEYANKLFGVFQRLHKSNDFEGTGVGLAIVQRIVAKHGGRVWAEAKVNEGASFYFSLPD